MHDFKESIRKDLDDVQYRIRREVVFKAAHFDELVDLKMDDLDHHACPAIVLAVSKACGYEGGKVVGLASIVELIYMADKVHNLIRDEDLTEAQRQFPVLVGDFLFGKYFYLLCQEQLLHFLAPLAQTIETMSQGSIGRWIAEKRKTLAEEYIQVLEREIASLTGIAARLGAELAGASDNIQSKLEIMGWNLGLAWGASREKLELSVINQALSNAWNVITELSEVLPIAALQELYWFISDRCFPEAN